MPNLAWLVPPVLLALTGSLPWLAVVLCSLVIWGVVYAAERAPLWYALLYPLGSVMLVGIMMRSAVRGKRIEWRGRVYGATPVSRRD
jgi:hypothetical protein